MKLPLKAFIATALAAIGLIAGSPIEAQAATASTCPANTLCLYDGTNFSGAVLMLHADNPGRIDLSFYTFNNGASANNAISSIRNNEDHIVSFYKDYFTGQNFLLESNTFEASLIFSADRHFSNNIGTILDCTQVPC